MKRQKFLPSADGKNFAISNGKTFSYDRKNLFWNVCTYLILKINPSLLLPPKKHFIKIRAEQVLSHNNLQLGECAVWLLATHELTETQGYM